MVPTRSNKIHHQDVMAVKLPAMSHASRENRLSTENHGSDLAMVDVGLCEETLQFCTEGWEGHWLRDDVIHSGLQAFLFVLR